MIGVFDSGAGGITAIKELRKILPSADICFLADRKNAPYGTKTPSELVKLVKCDISRLYSAGADKILMACCTASTVYPLLPRSMQKIAIPIISPAAREAIITTQNGKIGVIATERTVRSGAFTRILSKSPTVKSVIELPIQPLVTLVESGCTDERVNETQRDEISRLLRPFREAKIDTLILGCTHFPHLELTIGGCLPQVRLVSASKEGAREIIKTATHGGTGKTLYL